MATFKAKEVVAILKKLGFTERRQTSSHLILFRSEDHKIIPVPMHAKDLKRGLL